MSSIKLFIDMCHEMGIATSSIGIYDTAYVLHINGYKHVIIDKSMGLNDESMDRLCKDKFFHYETLSSVVAMPKSMDFIDPDPSGRYVQFSRINSIEEIVQTIEDTFSLPVIVKCNSGSTGENVYLCHDKVEIASSLKAIYSKKQLRYDHVAIAQEYIRPRRELRVIMFLGKVELVYLKDISHASFSGNLSPLHWQNASAKVISEENMIRKLELIANKIFNTIPLAFAGLDIIEDEDGKLWLIEVNNKPGFKEYLNYCDSKPLEKLYAKIIVYLKNKYRN